MSGGRRDGRKPRRETEAWLGVRHDGRSETHELIEQHRNNKEARSRVVLRRIRVTDPRQDVYSVLCVAGEDRQPAPLVTNGRLVSSALLSRANEQFSMGLLVASRRQLTA